MQENPSVELLDSLLDSWDRNNRILVNLLRAIPPDHLQTRAVFGSPCIAQLFTHIHFVRLVFVQEDAPAFAQDLPAEEWLLELDPARIERLLNESAALVRKVAEHTVREGEEMQRHYDHPLLFLQHMIWHEGYHHGQIKLALKLAGFPLSDEQIGPGTWSLWMKKSRRLT